MKYRGPFFIAPMIEGGITVGKTTVLKKSEPYFDRRTTGVIKGVALIMMFVHHFFTYPQWWDGVISYPLLEQMAIYFRAPLKICVPVFCFITGYFYYYNKNKNFKYSFKKITDILISYWVVFFIFAIIATTFVGYRYTIPQFILESFALYRPTMIFCWYVNFYIIFMLLFPLMAKFMSKNIHIDLILALLIIPNIFQIILCFVADYPIPSEVLEFQIRWISIVFVGYIFANYGLFEKIERLNKFLIRNKILNIIVLILVAICVPFGRCTIPTLTLALGALPDFNITLDITMDVIYAPIFIYCLANLCKMIDAKIVKKILIIIGKYSLLMWFVSCVFYGNCNTIFKPILYFPHDPILVTVWGLLLCLAVSAVLDLGIKKIQDCKNKLLFKIRK